MIISQEEDKYLNKWQLVETAVYIPSLSRVIRQKENGNTKFISVFDLEKFRQEHNNTGLYTSIWHYDTTDLDKALRLGSLYFDIDNADENIALQDCRDLYAYLEKYIPEESIIVYFTGKKGFHIECEAVCLGINPSNGLSKTFRYIAGKLKEELSLSSLDFAVYDQRRMWRLAGSKHQDTGLFKNRIKKDLLYKDISEIKEYCTQLQDNSIAAPEFNGEANKWYRQFTYDMETEKSKPDNWLEHFNKHGSGAFKNVNDAEKMFTPEILVSNCTAVARIIQQAKDKKHLDHESRLFLCSILTFNEDSVKFLHSILSMCNDYNFEKSSAHINDWIKRREIGIGGRPFSCERANSVGVGCGDCHLEKKKKWVQIGNKYVESNEESSPSPIRFAYKSIRKESNA
jgi:hypothetical protein